MANARPMPADAAFFGNLDNLRERKKLLFPFQPPNQEAIEKNLFELASGYRQSPDWEATARFGASLLQNASHSQAQLFQDLFVLHMLDFKQLGYFIEVGTGDGKTISNTYLLEKDYAWNGVVVEPNPVFLSSLHESRSCLISTDCVHDVSGSTVTFDCTHDPEFSGISFEERFASPSSELHAEKRANSRPLKLVTLSLNDLLAKFDAPRSIDYLSIDVEGTEFAILRTTDFLRWQIKCITIEHNWTPQRDDIHELLTAKGYVRVFKHISQWDDWYVQRDVLDARPDGASLLAEGDPGTGHDDALTLMRWSDEAVARGDSQVAMLLASRALELAPDMGSARRGVAQVLRQMGRPAAAIEQWRLALAADPDDYWAGVGLAELLMLRNERVEAISVLTHAAGLGGEDSVAAQKLADAKPSSRELAIARRLHKARR